MFMLLCVPVDILRGSLERLPQGLLVVCHLKPEIMNYLLAKEKNHIQCYSIPAALLI